MAEGVAGLSALTKEERVLLTAAQACFPCVERPFAALGEKVGLNEEAVLQRLERLKATNVIRKIGPVFEPARFGLASELVGVEIEPSHIEAVGTEVGSWAPVTHCYEREHRVNLWFAAVAPGEDWFESAAASTASLPGVRGVWRLPALRRFKIAVHFDLVASPSETPTPPASRSTASSPAGTSIPTVPASADSVDVDLLSVLETDLPLCPTPFAALASAAQMETAAILAALQQWTDDGRIRRYGAMVNHRRLGFTANSMTAWEVADDRVEEVGNCLASSPYVSH
ncbi:MAG: hypothetical protein GTO55_03955, partial [Armatimonadetes bacterium]|nr:hypothetical protein [Armatimonadota bacterium]NIM23426.1 hypothetical protein [Armatimonadota bacterium]NIM67291.1 hypothetical protein [Armatimonadota bacterium]NIM75789.1 hypothetical protein [Armatimonadota bacterium]NIN05477.1 hypothetical protein [Armatimonadota bacterium]